MNPSKKLCVLDLDGTLTKESSGLKLTRALYENGIFPEYIWKSMIELEYKHKPYLNDKDNYDRYICKLSNYFAKGVKGAKVKNVESVAEEVAEKLQYREECQDVIDEIKQKNFDVCIISASPFPIVKAVSKKLGVNKAYGLEVCVSNQVYQGKCRLIMNSTRKSRIINDVSKVYEFSVGIGDTINDMIAYSNLHLKFLLKGDITHTTSNDIIETQTRANDNYINEPNLMKIKRLDEIIPHLNRLEKPFIKSHF